MATKMRTRTVSIVPDPSLLPKSGQSNYSIPEAIGELIDNEVDARIAGEVLLVDVYIGTKGGGTIEVRGSGSGMDADTLAAAWRMGYSTKGPGAIGQFGLGLKTAATNLGRRVEIVSARPDGGSAARVMYDEDEFLARGEWAIDLEEIPKPFDHGTLITITRPKVSIYGGVGDTIALYAGRVWRHFIKSEQLEINVNGVPVMAAEWDLDEPAEEFVFEVNGKQVRGWLGLQRSFSPKTGYGFDLIRHNRVVRRHEKIGFKAHQKANKIVGEIHLDDFAVTNNKTDFMRDTPDWRAFEDEMWKLVRPLIQLANKRYSGQFAAKNEVVVGEIKEKIETAIRSEEFARSLDHRLLSDAITGELAPGEVEARSGNGHRELPEEPGARKGERTPDESRRRTPRETREVLRRTRTKLLDLTIDHVPVRFGPDSAYKTWDEEGVGTRHRLVVSSNLDHPMFAAVDDTVTWVKHNIAEAAAEFLGRETGLVNDMLKIKSDILRYVGELEIAEEQAVGATE